MQPFRTRPRPSAPATWKARLIGILLRLLLSTHPEGAGFGKSRDEARREGRQERSASRRRVVSARIGGFAAEPDAVVDRHDFLGGRNQPGRHRHPWACVRRERARVLEQPAAGGARTAEGDPPALDLAQERPQVRRDRGDRVAGRLPAPASSRAPEADEPGPEGESESEQPGERLSGRAARHRRDLPAEPRQEGRRAPGAKPVPGGGDRGPRALEKPVEPAWPAGVRSRTAPGESGPPRPIPRRAGTPRSRRGRPTRAPRGARRRGRSAAPRSALSRSGRARPGGAAGRPRPWRSTRSTPPSSRRGTRPGDRPRPGTRPARGCSGSRSGDAARSRSRRPRGSAASRASVRARPSTRGSTDGGKARDSSRSSSASGRRLSEPRRAGRERAHRTGVSGVPAGRRSRPKRSLSRYGASAVTASGPRGRRSGQRPTSAWSTLTATDPRTSGGGVRNQDPTPSSRGPAEAGGDVGRSTGGRAAAPFGFGPALRGAAFDQRRPSNRVKTSDARRHEPPEGNEVRRSSTRRRDVASSANSPRVDSPARPVSPWSSAEANALSMRGWRSGQPHDARGGEGDGEDDRDGDSQDVAAAPARPFADDDRGPEGEERRRSRGGGSARPGRCGPRPSGTRGPRPRSPGERGRDPRGPGGRAWPAPGCGRARTCGARERRRGRSGRGAPTSPGARGPGRGRACPSSG